MSEPTPISVAIGAIKEGLSANAGLLRARELGVGVRRATWLQLYAEVKLSLTVQTAEMTASLLRRPASHEVVPFRTQTASGYIQQVDVYALDKESGEVVIRPYSLRTDTLETRATAVDTALDLFGSAADRYGEQILGAAYTGTFILLPPEEIEE